MPNMLQLILPNFGSLIQKMQSDLLYQV